MHKLYSLENTDDCSGNECQNDATCLDALNSYTCQCAEGFEGNYCESMNNIASSFIQTFVLLEFTKFNVIWL